MNEEQLKIVFFASFIGNKFKFVCLIPKQTNLSLLPIKEASKNLEIVSNGFRQRK
jgi:hypothetical protein